MILVKLSTKNNKRSDVVELGELFKARVLDVALETVTLELTGETSKIESFLTLAKDLWNC